MCFSSSLAISGLSAAIFSWVLAITICCFRLGMNRSIRTITVSRRMSTPQIGTYLCRKPRMPCMRFVIQMTMSDHQIEFAKRPKKFGEW